MEAQYKPISAEPICAPNLPYVLILKDNLEIPDLPLENYEWAVVINDPCGHSGHAVEIMQEIARRIRRSDFIVAVNEGGIRRHLNLTEVLRDHALASVRASYETKEQYRWMLSFDEWKVRLGKQYILVARNVVANKAFQGRILVISNAKAKLSARLFNDA